MTWSMSYLYILMNLFEYVFIGGFNSFEFFLCFVFPCGRVLELSVIYQLQRISMTYHSILKLTKYQISWHILFGLQNTCDNDMVSFSNFFFLFFDRDDENSIKFCDAWRCKSNIKTSRFLRLINEEWIKNLKQLDFK